MFCIQPVWNCFKPFHEFLYASQGAANKRIYGFKKSFIEVDPLRLDAGYTYAQWKSVECSLCIMCKGGSLLKRTAARCASQTEPLKPSSEQVSETTKYCLKKKQVTYSKWISRGICRRIGSGGRMCCQRRTP